MIDPKLKTEKICNCVEDISRGKLNGKEDLFRIIELALSSEKMPLLEELSFQAKYTQGLVSIIRKNNDKIDEEYFNKVESEFIESIEKVKKQIEEIMLDASDFLKTIFYEKYFQMTQQGISNLNDLCSDLYFLKLYFNDVRRNSQPN